MDGLGLLRGRHSGGGGAVRLLVGQARRLRADEVWKRAGARVSDERCGGAKEPHSERERGMNFTEPMTAPEDTRAQVEKLARWVADARARASGELRLVAGTDASEVVPAVVVEVLEKALNTWKDGNAVVVGVVPQALTLRDAAALLNVSEAYVGTLVQEGKLVVQGEGARRRLKLGDVLKYRELRDGERRRILDEMVKQTEEDGGYPEWKDASQGGEGS